MRKFAIASVVALLTGCARTGGTTDVATKLASPQGAALIAGLANFAPGVSAAANKAVSGQAVQNDKAMVCQGIAWANAADLLFGADLGSSVQDAIGPGLLGAQTACNSPTTDIASVIQTAATAFLATQKALAAQGATAPAS